MHVLSNICVKFCQTFILFLQMILSIFLYVILFYFLNLDAYLLIPDDPPDIIYNTHIIIMQIIQITHELIAYGVIIAPKNDPNPSPIPLNADPIPSPILSKGPLATVSVYVFAVTLVSAFAVLVLTTSIPSTS